MVTELTHCFVNVLLAVHDNHPRALICRLDDDVLVSVEGVKCFMLFSGEVVTSPAGRIISLVNLGADNLYVCFN